MKELESFIGVNIVFVCILCLSLVAELFWSRREKWADLNLKKEINDWIDTNRSQLLLSHSFELIAKKFLRAKKKSETDEMVRTIVRIIHPDRCSCGRRNEKN